MGASNEYPYILNNKPSTQVAAELNNNHQVVGDHVVIGKSKSTKLKSTSTNGTNTTTSAEGLIETSLSSDNSSGSNSDNSSTDEGIDNPEDVVLDDDDDENGSVLKIDHQQTHLHHEHHHNHHYQHHRRNRNPSGGAESTNSTIIQGSLTPTTTVSTTEAFEEDEQQVERFLNGTNIKHFNDLKTEESNLLKEIELLELEQSETEIKCRLNSQKESLQKSSNNIDNDDDDDEELLEFQRIECEIKLSELRKCLLVIQKQIENYRKKLDIEVCEDQLSINRPICSSLLFANMTDSMLEECRLDAEQQINLDDSLKEEHLAPLASADEWDTESQNTNLSLPISLTKSSTKIESDLPAAQQPTSLIKSIGSLENSNVHLSDTDDSDDETTTFELKKNLNQNGKTPPRTPIRKESLQSNNTFNINEAATLERDDFHRQSLHEELLHESIEQSLKQINSVSDEDQEQFVISPAATKPPLPKRSSIEDSPPVDDGSNNQSSLKNGGSTSLIRRDSQYENEQNHRCDITHSRGYERIQMLNNRSAQLPVTASKMESSNNENKSHSLDDLLKSDKDNQDDVVAMKRRSAKFPTENVTQHELDTTNQPNVRKRNSESSNTINSRTSISSTSQRPLTIYLPSHSEQLNLITHLHKQGHDLTSSIVTNHLLITPFTCSGYLYKQCSGSSSKWRKRYFHFNRVRKVFVYFHDRNAFEKRRHPKRGVFFDEIQDVYVDHTRINVKKFFGSSNGSNGSNDRHQSPSRHSHHLMNTSLSASSSGNNSRSVFVVATTTMNRKFTLSTFSPELMRIWMDIIFTGANAYLQDYEFDA
ncbi:hypothetical protein RDWZM_006357 [Blomia tropicalis]|uniref:PH domain-containing protein n=1 Tax=Blomia tropicalis TaxID=40697 RepID=A0A9Q0M7I1_BLOTA|nr:hypothetical protein RDWZM_006357 [Blomia tropicalis]